jgi:hypothetical protein
LGCRVGALRLASQHHPGGSAWGQRRAGGLRPRGQGRARAAGPGREALGLPHTAGLGRAPP